MGKIISVIGNLGAGKTTITKFICEQRGYIPYWERPEEHPFHLYFAEDARRWALANQIDFFLFRCKQEANARQSEGVSVFDGGFDQDFHVFTRHFYNKGYLNPAEYDVCQRFYHFARELLPPPDLIIRVVVDFPLLLQRRLVRGRQTDEQFLSSQELTDFELLIDEWLKCETSSPVICFSFERDLHDCTNDLEQLGTQINQILNA